MYLSITQAQFDIFYLGLPYKIELSHYGFYAVMDMDGEYQIPDMELEGKILNKFFVWRNRKACEVCRPTGGCPILYSILKYFGYRCK